MEHGYHSVNPYHNGVHAADVTQAMHCFLRQDVLRRTLSPLEVMAALVASVCHDLDHPGMNERFLVATHNHLAGLYNNSSVLENHHWRSGLSLLWSSGLADHLAPHDLARLRRTLRAMVLATDITRQREFLDRLRSLRSEGGLTAAALAASAERRTFILQIAMKCADISNPCRPWSVCRLWSHRASEEFFRQGDREKELGLEVSNLCDRTEMTVAKVRWGIPNLVNRVCDVEHMIFFRERRW